MSEYIDNYSQRMETLKDMIRQLHAGAEVDHVKARFAELLQEVGAGEIAQIEQELITEGLPATEIRRLCDVHVSVFRDSLDQQAQPESVPGHPVYTLRAENEAAAAVLDDLERAIQRGDRPSARRLLASLMTYERHYARKENVLFPYLEKYGFTGPSSVMWAIHDDIRADLRRLAALLDAEPQAATGPLSQEIQQIFFKLSTAIREMFYKEDKILLPAALERLNLGDWTAIRNQEDEIGYAFVQPGDEWLAAPPIAQPTPAHQPEESGPQAGISLSTGALSASEINAIFGLLPLDVTFVDKDDKVKFFSESRDRIFQRTPAVIGRSVQACHPQASVHRVQQILDDFRAGRRDVAEFWIQMQDRFIHIRYFPVRDDQGSYLGTLEVTQDITRLRNLDGERRLLDEET